MKLIAPNYYKDFHCIADRCHHSCCIGWEIDIDEDSLAFYRTVDGAFGERLQKNVAYGEDGAHFRLSGTEERCPFLRRDGLCDMILTLGEDSLCNICREHPRFYLPFSDRDEVGLGLCCEEAARLILSQNEAFALETVFDDGEETEAPSPWETELTRRREEMFFRIQDKGATLDGRIDALLAQYGADIGIKNDREWLSFLLTLEMLDPAWEETLRRAKSYDGPLTDSSSFEKLLLYFLYRHTAEAQNLDELSARVAFACLSLRIVRLLCAAESGKAPTLETIADLARRYSAEIEYSESNTEKIIAMQVKYALQ